MIKSLFKPSWKSKSVDKRLRFIADVAVSVTDNQTILEKLASSDADAGVRHAAMAKISNLQALYTLCHVHKNTGSREFAETAFRNLIQSGELTEGDFRKFLTSNPKANLLIAKYCPHIDLRNEILLTLDESDQASLIADIPYSATRVMVADNIHSLNSLEIARKNLKGRDKSAEKIIKAKIDGIHAKQKLDLENTALAKSIREEMESLARYIAWSDEIKVKFFSLTKSWDTLAFDPSEEEKALYGVALTKVGADVKHNLAIGLSAQSQEKIVSKLEATCTEVAGYPLDKLLSESTVLSNKLRDLNGQWNKEVQIKAPAVDARTRFSQASKSLESAITMSRCVSESRGGEVGNESAKTSSEKGESQRANQQAKAILQATDRSDWSSHFPALASAGEASTEAKSVLNAANDERKQAKDALDNLHKKINRLFGATNRGDLNRAQRDLASVAKAASHYEGKERKSLDERIQEASDSVTKMGDWKDFAVEPKLVDLCDQMEALAKTETPNPDKQALNVKKLQEAWKALGSSSISDTYWPRFKEAGDKAYEPCSIFFKQRRDTQRDNLKKRDPLVGEMQDLLESTDWDAKPDHKSVEEGISQIMKRWKLVKDVEHGSGQKQWNKLSAIKDQINEKLGVEYDKNIASKHTLTAQLEQMLAQDVTEQSFEKLQFIQSKWKQIGLTRRSQDQKAWVKFKASSDAVYEKIQDLRQAKRSVEDEQVGAYKQIHTQIHNLAKSTQDMAVSDKEFESLEVQYKDLPALPSGFPEKQMERLDSDYAKACNAYEGARVRLDKAKLDNELEVLSSKAQLCSELEQLIEQSPENGVKDEASALLDKINNLELVNKKYIKRFARRLEKARDTDREGYSAARRTLLIDCEILLDIDSPKEDKDLRLQTQLDRMKQQGIGNASTSAATMDELKLEWLCMPGAEAKLQQQFDDRFSKLMKQKTSN